ncbi:MAG: nucleoside hydrolase [Planctomycetota bacterium]
MNRKIIIDCDPGIDDAIALTMALFDPRLEVLAVTATAGCVDAAQATNNVNAIIEFLDPPRYPRVGKASSPSHAPVDSDSTLHGSDGLGGLNLRGSNRQHLPASEKVMADLFRLYPGEITLVCLGPLTNLSAMIQRDPAAVAMIDKVIVSGGAISAPGNASCCAEFNMFFDPPAAKEVFASATTKSLVPLDVTGNFTFGVELLERLPDRNSRAGKLLHHVLTFAFRMSHNRLGREMLPLYDPTTMLSLFEPELFTWEPMAGDVETQGKLTRGMTVFDLRLRPEWSTNLEVATNINDEDAELMLVQCLKYAGQRTGS